MNETNFRDKIDSELAFINMTEKQRIRFTEAGHKPVKNIYRPKRIVVAAVAVLVCIMLSVPVLGATVTAYNNIVSRISPELADFLMPRGQENSEGTLGASVIDNGITVTVVSAVIDDYHMMAVLEIQDDEGRLKDGVLPIYDGSNMNAWMNDIVGDYNDSTGTLTILWYEITTTPHTGGGAEILITRFSETDNGFDEYIRGSWALTFVPEYIESTRYGQQVDFEEYSLYDIALSPISMTMKTTAELYVEDAGSEKPHMLPVEVEIIISDGTVYRFTNDNSQIDYGCQLTFYYSVETGSIDIAFATLINSDDIVSVSINGEHLVYS